MTTMKAIRIHQFGGPEVLQYEDAQRPEPAEGEVLLRVHATSVNPIDWKTRAGYLQNYIPHKLPLILGWDASGTIAALGPGVRDHAVGDEVFTRPDPRRDGAYAEYIAVPAAELAAKPKSIDHVHAAAVPLAGLTAWQGLLDPGNINLQKGQTVLIHGAAGGVGSFAVQIAKWRGARVVASGSPRNEGFLRELGADVFLDYNRERFEDVVRDVDAVLDIVGGQTQARSWAVLKAGGVLASTVGPPSPDADAQARGVRVAAIGAKTIVSQLDEMAALIDRGLLRPIVTEILPLSEARKAHELSQTGHARGKIVLQVVG
jgi:NADPH:quinone reductase-like Zn-dependent oxidoreductase